MGKTVRNLEKSYDIIVIGGGLSGICAALAAARQGVKTALVQGRSMFGGNASSEIRINIFSAGCHNTKPDSNETGLLMELLLENKHRNPYHSFSVWDSILWEKVRFQENLDSYLNTVVSSVEMEGDRIKTLIGYQQSTETELRFHAGIVIDATGHGTIGVLAGAENRIGSESKNEFNEASAPETANRYTMSSSIMFQAADRGKPVKFEKPAWAYSFTEEDLKFRQHGNNTAMISNDGTLAEFHDGKQGALPEFACSSAGYWWIELGGDYDDIIAQAEDLRDELLKCVYGVWEHIKNCGDHGAENFDLEWVGIVPGYRESRRLAGDYFLNENDVRDNRVFPDAVAYGGWPMDIHSPGGLKVLDKVPSVILNFDGLYTIPYRCYYSKNISNLMMAGRDISTSKMAFSSTRIMGTCAIGGQAAGTAAAMAVKYRCTPREIGGHITELQQQLLRDDCYIPGFEGRESADLAQKAKVSADSFVPGCEPAKVLNGIARPVGNEQNCWESAPLGKDGQRLFLTLPEAKDIHEIRLTFDPNLSREIMPSMITQIRDRQATGCPEELVKDYTVELWQGEKKVFSQSITGNYQRLNLICIDPAIKADRAIIHVLDTNGYPSARIFEVRLY
ncbi:hypothetical protein FACS189442_0470 [Spirochaetia bacterium]|nr:hypothetical protein FACS189442_0470 [Spirochaetia bacterium]